jgi:hypothetical protein
MWFTSDNAGPAAPEVMAAVAAANAGHAPSYGADAITDRVTDRLRALSACAATRRANHPALPPGHQLRRHLVFAIDCASWKAQQ